MGRKSNKPDAPFQLSRTALEEFLACPRCFWLHRKRGIVPPAGFPFTLNGAVDALLKRECDAARMADRPTELTKLANAKPYKHPKLDEWRDFRHGVRFLHQETNIEVFGAIDDLWIGLSEPVVHVVDYKATAASKPVTEMSRPFHMNYKRQVEVYSWLLSHNGVPVSQTAYFLYCTAMNNAEAFGQTLRFRCAAIPHECRTAWIDSELQWVRKCLDAEEAPKGNDDCAMCKYVSLAGAAILTS